MNKLLSVFFSLALAVGLCPGLAFANPGEGGGSAPDVSAVDDQASIEQLEVIAEDVSVVEESGENVSGSAYPVVEGFDKAMDADAPLTAQADDADSPLTAQANGYLPEFLSQVNAQPNGTRGSKYGLNSNWCARFVWKCAEWAGVSSNVIPHTDACSTMVTWFKNQGRWHSYTYTPKAGDLIFYNWSSASGGAQHVGVVTGVSGKKVYTKEGNTGNGVVDSFSNRTAGVSKQGNGWAYIIGYATPNYTTPPAPSTPTEKPPTPVYTGTVTTIPDGIYTIRCAANTAFAVDVSGGSKDNGAQIQLWRYYRPTNNQKFRFTKNSDGTYKIANVGSGKVFDVHGNSLLNHANVEQYTDHGGANQRWYVEKNSDGTFSIRSKLNNLYLDIWGGTVANGTKITTYVGNYSAAQKLLLWQTDVENQVEGDVLSISDINASYTQTGSAITPIPTVQRVVYQKEAMRVPQSGTASADYIWQDACWITKGKTYTVDVGSLQRLSGNNTQATMALYDFGASKFLHEKRFDISANKQTYTFTAPADGMLLFYAGVTGACKGCAVQWNNVTVREKLVANTDYTCSYANNINPGTATLTVTLKGSFKKSKSASFKITEAPNPAPTPTPTPKPAPSPAPTPDVGDTQEAGQTMYRLYNPNSGEHFYTSSTIERDNVIEAGWNDEGVGWTAPGSGIKVYRLYNPYAGEHHYTTSEEERDMLVSVGWIWEEGGWFSNPAEGMPLYRAYNPNAFANNHHYTSDWGEFQTLLSVGWLDEGIGWYGVG